MQQFTWGGHSSSKNAGDLTIKTYGNVNAAENALGYDLDGVAGNDSPYAGPVTVVFGNVDGGDPDFAMVLFNTSGVSASDFIFSAPAAASVVSTTSQSSALLPSNGLSAGLLNGSSGHIMAHFVDPLGFL